MKISIIIPVYKNKELFLTNLISNYPLMKNHEIVIVDDASEENIDTTVKEKYPDITILVNDKNLGFAPTVNRGAFHAKGDIIVLLNSDVKLQKKLDEVIKPFENDGKLFAVSFSQIEKDGSITGKNKIFFHDGFVRHSQAGDTKSGLNAWAEGGAGAIRGEFFRKIGGFREIYTPFYWEDIDLSYRAYSAGWHILFDSNYQVEHRHESTIGRYFNKNYIKTIAYRNQLFFIWSNIKDKNLLLQHTIFLPIHLLRTCVHGDFQFFQAFIMALVKIPEVLRVRGLNAKDWYIKDDEIFDRLKNT